MDNDRSAGNKYEGPTASNRKYKIGEYAKYMGVTPDLLKHYKEIGLLVPDKDKNGYRMYPFNITPKLVECLRLKSYKLTLKEIKEMFDLPDTKQITDYIAEKVEEMEEMRAWEDVLIDDFRTYETFVHSIEGKDSEWGISLTERMYFLPHTLRYEFLKDPRIYEILKAWMRYIPVVKSMLQVKPDGSLVWGFVVSERNLKRLHLPINDVVVRIEPEKMFFYSFVRKQQKNRPEPLPDENHPAVAQLHALNLKPKGECYKVILSEKRETDGSVQYGYYAIPFIQ